MECPMRDKFVVFVMLLGLVGCGDATEQTQKPETSVVEIDDAQKADSFGEVRVRAAEMTIWADPVIEPTTNGWRLSARSSYNLASIRASIGGADVDAKLVGDRTFDINLDAQRLVTNLQETPIFVELTTTSGLQRTAMFVSRARVGYSSGSYRIYPWKNFEPIFVGGEAVFRGRMTTEGEFDEAYGFNDDDSEPVVTREDETHWLVDFPSYAIPWAAHPTEDPVVYVVENTEGTRYRRDVHIVMQLSQMGVTSGVPSNVWPAPMCQEEVRGCVQARGRDADLEACGSVVEVRPCLEELPEDNTDELVNAFASGLRSAIIDFYGRHEDDIVNSGGEPRTHALRSVDTRDIEEVVDPEETPGGYALSDYRVFYHPDVVFPGSGAYWYGVFDRRNDALVDVFRQD